MISQEFPSTVISGNVFANPVLVMKAKSRRHRFMVVAVMPVVVLVVLMLMMFFVISRLSKYSVMGGYLTMFKFSSQSDAPTFMQSEENFFL